MSRPAVRLLALSVLVAMTACAAAGERRARSTVNRNVLTLEELSTSGYMDAHTAVQSLRPRWLNTRGQASLQQSEFIRVYLDGSLLGGTDHLRQISVPSIASMEYLDGLQATQRYGLDHGQGAIVVVTRRD